MYAYAIMVYDGEKMVYENTIYLSYGSAKQKLVNLYGHAGDEYKDSPEVKVIWLYDDKFYLTVGGKFLLSYFIKQYYLEN